MHETDMNPDNALDRAIDAMREVEMPRAFSAEKLIGVVLDSQGQPRRTSGLRLRLPIARPWFRIAALLTVVTAVVVTVTLTRFVGTIALGDVVEQFRHARGMTARITVTIPGRPTRVQHAMFLGQDRFRFDNGDTTEIDDLARHVGLVLDARNKTATLLTLEGDKVAARSAAGGEAVDWFTELRQLDEAHSRTIGRQTIDGRPAQGFEGQKAGFRIIVWADRQTCLPLRIEATIAGGGSDGPMVRLDQISLNDQLPESLFSLDIPPRYVVQRLHMRASAQSVSEDDLIDYFRKYAQLHGGQFPPAFGGHHWADAMTSLDQEPTTQPRQELVDFAATAMRAVLFVNKLKPGWQYLGAGARLGDADRPIFQYRREPSAPSRVIYGDLHSADLNGVQLSRPTSP